jgi:hypothetical protein
MCLTRTSTSGGLWFSDSYVNASPPVEMAFVPVQVVSVRRHLVVGVVVERAGVRAADGRGLRLAVAHRLKTIRNRPIRSGRANADGLVGQPVDVA